MPVVVKQNPILKTLLADIANQPDWRDEAAIDMAWRDNIQWTKQQQKYFKDLGLPSNLFVNLMASAMDAVTGYEAKHQVDWMITAAGEEQEEMAEAFNHDLNDIMRLADANHACSEAYAPQAGVGIGWVHIDRSRDILSTVPYVIEDVHRDEMFWDMRSRSDTLRTDCRWIARRRFFDVDSAKMFFGDRFHDLIDFVCSDWGTVDIGEGSNGAAWFPTLNEYTEPIELILETNSSRKRIAVYEVYYKVFQKKTVISLADGMTMILDKNNSVHLDMIAGGMATVHVNVPINSVRLSWFIGPYCVHDGDSPHPHNHFPYVPFFGSREDSTNAPSGLLRRMRGPQEQYNRAVLEIQRILRSRRVEKNEDSVPDLSDQQVISEVNRSDGLINIRKGREFRVIREWEKVAALEKICERARNEINAASGVYQTFQGQTETSQSGIAVESIAELGAQTLGKINANYQLARKMVGDLVFSYLVSDIGDQEKTINIPQQVGQVKKQVVLNDGSRNNSVPLLRAQVALQDVHTAAGYRQHTHQRVTGIIEKVPDEFKALLLPFWLETSEMPKKEQAIKMVNKKLGVTQDEDKQEALEQQQQQEAQQQKELEIRALLADIAEKEATAKDRNAQAVNHTAEAIKKRAETVKLLREVKAMSMTSAGSNVGQGKVDKGEQRSITADPRGARPLEQSGV